jgi:hypothetical protein
MPKAGRSLELLVRNLENALSKTENASIESPKKLRDKITGRLREHDVVVTIEHAHHKITIAFECRDRSRPIGVPQVEAFKKKCEDTGIDSAVMVSPRGFYRTGKAKAEYYGIKCLNLKEVDSFDWLFVQGMTTISRKLIHTNWIIVPEDPHIRESIGEFQLVTEDGNPVAQGTLNQNVLNHLGRLGLIEEPGTDKHARLVFEGEGTRILDVQSGNTHAIRVMIAHATYNVEHEYAPFRLFRYSEEGSTSQIADAAVARIRIEDFERDFIAVRDPDLGIKMILAKPEEE